MKKPLLLLALVVLNQSALLTACAAERYAALFSDGARVEEAEVREWFEPTSTAKIAGRALQDPNNPVRWIIDRQQTVAPEAGMFVEFQGGDRLAGEVTSFQDETGNSFEYRPAHLIVQPVAENFPPEDPQQTDVRVSLDWLRRVVWQKSAADEYRPGTAWLRSGAMQTFRTLRWSESGVTLLTTDGVKELSFADLAEIHLPKSDPWVAYYEQLSALTPSLKSRLTQMETSDGSRWTTSLERFQARHVGDRNRPEQWFQLIQPAWSLDPIWLRYRTIRLWRFHAPTDVPLSNLLPTEANRQAVFGSGWRWRVNQNVQRGPLQSATQEFGWGFGVQATCDLAFEWPETARAWRTQFGLDRTAGSGGFVRLKFSVGNGQIVGPVPTLQGSQTVGDTGWLTLPTVPSDQRKLVLYADMAHSDRPPEADPFDVRDSVNWYEPEIRLDAAALAAEVAGRGIARVSGLHGWTMSTGDARSMILNNSFDVTNGRDPQFRLTVGTPERFYSASRKVKVSASHRWLSIALSRYADTTPSFAQVRIDGRLLGEFEIPLRNSLSDPDPILLPVAEYQGKTIALDLVVFSSDAKSLVDWRGIALTAERPGILTIFEDDPQFASLLNRGTGQVEITNDKPFSGSVSVKVTGDAGDNSRLPGLEANIVDQTKLGQYRFVLFAWKQSTGSRVQLQFASDGRLGEQLDPAGRRDPFRGRGRGRNRFDSADERGLRYGYAYDAGNQRQMPGSALRLNGALPKDWQLQSRDLYGDFGVFNLTGIALSCVDGEAAWFDHIYLCRNYQDVEYVRTLLVNPIPAPPARDPNIIDIAYQRNDYGRVLEPFTSQFSALDLAHGLIRMKEHAGQTDALRTHPNAADKPAIFHAGVTLPKDKPAMLDMHVSHFPQSDWQLVVKANGEVIHNERIDQKLTLPQRGWASIQIDLSRFAGQKVFLEVLNQSNGRPNEFAFWKRMAIVDK